MKLQKTGYLMRETVNPMKSRLNKNKYINQKI